MVGNFFFAQKAEARRHFEGLRRALPFNAVLAASAAAAGHLAASSLARPLDGWVATYAAQPFELDPTPAADALQIPDVQRVYPRVVGDVLRFHAVPRAALEMGPLGLLEPPPGAPAVALESIALWLVPGVAFDTAGGRLGRGRGYYDRALAQCRPGALRIGLCHASNLAPTGTFPVTPTDLRMDAILTEAGFLWCAG